MLVDEMLAQFGITQTPLSPHEREALDRDGYVVLPGIIDADWLARLRAAFESGCEKDGHAPVVKESGTPHVDDLVNRDPVFEGVYTNRRVLAAVYYVLREAFRVGQIGGRDPLPGFGRQGLHTDWTARTKGEPFRIVTAIWLLDDFTSENGATRVVPGTHHLLTQPPKSFADPASRHPDQRSSSAKLVRFWCSTATSGTAERRTNRVTRGVCCSARSLGVTSFASPGSQWIVPNDCHRLLATFWASEGSFLHWRSL